MKPYGRGGIQKEGHHGRNQRCGYERGRLQEVLVLSSEGLVDGIVNLTGQRHFIIVVVIVADRSG